MTKRPHDAIVKAVFGNPRHAAAELRHMLSEEVAKAIDWNTLTLESGEFVDEELADHHSDLLFSAMATSGVPVLVYLLLEHQSSPDSSMPLRFMDSECECGAGKPCPSGETCSNCSCS